MILGIISIALIALMLWLAYTLLERLVLAAMVVVMMAMSGQQLIERRPTALCEGIS